MNTLGDENGPAVSRRWMLEYMQANGHAVCNSHVYRKNTNMAKY